MVWRVIPRVERDLLGEGLLWSARENAVFWTDIIGKRLWRLSLDDESVRHWEMPEMTGWIIEREAGGFIVGLQSGFHRLTLDPWQIERVANPHPERPGNRLNDAKADRHGRIWAGSMSVSSGPPSGWPATGALYRLDPDGAITVHDDGLTIANGPAISPDGTTLFHTDSAPGIVYRFALRPDGELGPREQHLSFDPGDGAPDGMTCDSDGGLWVAFYGGGRVARFDAAGRFDREIVLPTPRITNVVFAGAALDRMFITSSGEGLDAPLAGGLFEVDPGCTGVAPYRFAG